MLYAKELDYYTIIVLYQIILYVVWRRGRSARPPAGGRAAPGGHGRRERDVTVYVGETLVIPISAFTALLVTGQMAPRNALHHPLRSLRSRGRL